MEDLSGGTLALEHRYDVLERHARHGVVTLYKGRQEPFGKPVWVKTFDALDDDGVARLEACADVASQLTSPNLLRILDHGELQDRVPFVISERMDAATLAEVLADEGTLSPRTTARLIDQLASIVGPIHRQTLAHGALATHWIYLADADVQRVDVGHAQLGLATAELIASGKTGAAPEAVAALAPELLAAGRSADDQGGQDAGQDAATDPLSATNMPATDVWALGVIAYTSLVGFHPFIEADTALDQASLDQGIDNIIHEPVRPLDELGVAAAVSRVICRALAKDPAQRFETADAFAQALGAAQSGDRGPRRPDTVDAGASATLDPPGPGDQPNPGSPANIADIHAHQREPGPSDRLLTIAVAALILSNLAWIFYLTGRDATETPATATSPPATATSAPAKLKHDK